MDEDADYVVFFFFLGGGWRMTEGGGVSKDGKEEGDRQRGFID